MQYQYSAYSVAQIRRLEQVAVASGILPFVRQLMNE